MASTSNGRFLMSGKPINELVLHLCQKQFETINIVIANKDSSAKMPRSNPFQFHSYIKQAVTEHANITNMKYTRQGKLLFSTSDPVCAAKLLVLQTVLDTPVSTDIIWENITSRFLISDIPTKTTLEEIADELSHNNDIVITHMRRFVKQNSSNEVSPLLVTILGTSLPDSVKIWFINQKIQPFIDRPRKCLKCFSFYHPTRICVKRIQFATCVERFTLVQGPTKCRNCQGPHPAISKACPMYSKE
ncbi:hypothetical protein AVEN_237799-1 [Araneus ventricosus]|uniref:Pre-C2HC domain-containing protein n=1 Tax=Araneus ventricosus TaxID=182803 RepID=A0A4Y2RKJ5_ARAVE|nr:hypothetical protein AVEN_237799-1 [Araneus ventricosus]